MKCHNCVSRHLNRKYVWGLYKCYFIRCYHFHQNYSLLSYFPCPPKKYSSQMTVWVSTHSYFTTWIIKLIYRYTFTQLKLAEFCVLLKENGSQETQLKNMPCFFQRAFSICNYPATRWGKKTNRKGSESSCFSCLRNFFFLRHYFYLSAFVSLGSCYLS